MQRPDLDPAPEPRSSNGFSSPQSDTPSVPWNLWDVVMATLFAVGLGGAIIVIFITMGGLLSGFDAIAGGTPAVILTGLLYGTAFAGVWLFAVHKYGGAWAALGFRRVSTRNLFLLPAIALVLIGVFNFAYEVVIEALGNDFLLPTPNQDLDALFTEDGGFIPLAVVNTVLLVPLVEEAYIRGFMMTALIAVIGGVRGAIVSSAIFAALHLNISVIIPLFFTGMVMAWLYLRTGSLLPPIAAHAAQNALALATYRWTEF